MLWNFLVMLYRRGKMMDKYNDLIVKGRKAYLEAMETIGWLKYSGPSKTETEKRLSEITEPEYFVYALCDLSFDPEGFEDKEAYESLLNEILYIVQLRDTSLSVSQNDTDGIISIEIKTGKNTYPYSVLLEDFDDWVDGDIIDKYFNEEILPGEDEERRLLPLSPSDQKACFVFMPEKLYEKAIEMGIIPGEGDYFMKEIETKE
ncbi:hypothetical protein [Breznakiella homolactica]|uniref:Uncharacterized protein n=1 Tax=Breznakiella homolactica TaxID=2798577 RepID=A0A7T7XJV0_9SPIR|nr:hypothetical protein [Breznakiella homolactica]QQO07630.1 hypothetical protein JFL75_11800 [Breznakiella homolactica]